MTIIINNLKIIFIILLICGLSPKIFLKSNKVNFIFYNFYRILLIFIYFHSFYLNFWNIRSIYSPGIVSKVNLIFDLSFIILSGFYILFQFLFTSFFNKNIENILQLLSKNYFKYNEKSIKIKQIFVLIFIILLILYQYFIAYARIKVSKVITYISVSIPPKIETIYLLFVYLLLNILNDQLKQFNNNLPKNIQQILKIHNNFFNVFIKIQITFSSIFFWFLCLDTLFFVDFFIFGVKFFKFKHVHSYNNLLTQSLIQVVSKVMQIFYLIHICVSVSKEVFKIV